MFIEIVLIGWFSDDSRFVHHIQLYGSDIFWAYIDHVTNSTLYNWLFVIIYKTNVHGNQLFNADYYFIQKLINIIPIFIAIFYKYL